MSLKLKREPTNLPNEIALINMMDARMNMIRDVRPRKIINLLTKCCPAEAAIVTTTTK